jgi:hypothetical protein
VADQLAVFDEQTALDVLATIQAVKDSGLLELDTNADRREGSKPRTVYNTPLPTYVYNDSGSAIPAYGLMQMTTTLDEDGRSYIKVKQPIDSTLLRCPLLVNSGREIAIGGYGIAQLGPVFRLLHDGGTYVAGDRLGAKAGTFTATYGALYAVIGADAIDVNIVRVMFDTSAFKGKTKSVPLVVGIPAKVFFVDAAGTVTTREYLAETDVSDIPANTPIRLDPMYGRLVASKVC